MLAKIYRQKSPIGLDKSFLKDDGAGIVFSQNPVKPKIISKNLKQRAQERNLEQS